MIPSDGRVGRQIEDIRQVIASVELRRLKIQDRRNQDDAIEIHSVPLLKVPGKARRARGAVTFAGEEFWRGPAFVASGIEPNEIRDGLDIFGDAVKLFRRFAGNGSAVPSRDGINEYEVADVQE